MDIPQSVHPRNKASVKICVQVFFVLVYLVASVVSDSATPWTVTHQAPLSMGFSRQECWSGLPFLFPGDLPDPGIEPWSPALLLFIVGATKFLGGSYRRSMFSFLKNCQTIFQKWLFHFAFSLVTSESSKFRLTSLPTLFTICLFNLAILVCVQ